MNCDLATLVMPVDSDQSGRESAASVGPVLAWIAAARRSRIALRIVDCTCIKDPSPGWASQMLGCAGVATPVFWIR